VSEGDDDSQERVDDNDTVARRIKRRPPGPLIKLRNTKYEMADETNPTCATNAIDTREDSEQTVRLTGSRRPCNNHEPHNTKYGTLRKQACSAETRAARRHLG
jgi:hypothetical protein